MAERESEKTLANNDLTGLLEWSLDEQKEAQELKVEYAIWDVDLGKTSLLKHSIELMDSTLFKDVIDVFHRICMRRHKKT